MGKRTSGDFERNKHDAYDTFDGRPVQRLLEHLPPKQQFIEPCAGRGALIHHLRVAGHCCVGAFDIEPRDEGAFGITTGDATKLALSDQRTWRGALHLAAADLFITNPPWTQALLEPLILNLYWQRPTWMLLSADWQHTDQAQPFMPICSKIVTGGRTKWIEGSAHSGKDNVAWYCFEPQSRPVLLGRFA
jgi:hypothetical protein